MSYSPEFLDVIARMREKQSLADREAAESRRRAEQNQHAQAEQIAARMEARRPERDEQVSKLLQLAGQIGAAAARKLKPTIQIATRNHWWNKPIVQYAGWALTPLPRYASSVYRQPGGFLGIDYGLYSYIFYTSSHRTRNDGLHILKRNVIVGHEYEGEGKYRGSGEDAYYDYESSPIYADEEVVALTGDKIAEQIDYFNEHGTNNLAHPYTVYTESLARFAFNNQPSGIGTRSPTKE